VAVPAQDELPPILTNLEMVAEDVVTGHVRPERVPPQAHARFFKCAAALAMVAVFAGRHEVLPDVLAAEAARHDMIERQVTALCAAVLTGMVVALQDVAAAEPELRTWTPDEVDKADDRWKLESVTRAAENAGALLQNLGFPPVDEQEGAPSVAHIERLVVLIEDEYSAVYHIALRDSEYSRKSV
jgi:hypothetical protein